MSMKNQTPMIAALLAVVMVAGLLFGLLSGSVSAASSGEIQNQIDRLEAQQAELKAQMAKLENSLAENQTDIKTLVARKNGIDQQVALLHSQVTVVMQTITAYNLMIADKQDELDMAEKKLQSLHKAYKARIRAMEEQGQISYWAVIFEASSFFEMLDHLKMMAEIEAADRRRLDEIRTVAEKVELARAELQEQKKSLEVQRQELEAAQADLEVKSAEADGLLLELLVRGDEYEFAMSESEKLQHELMDQIAKLEIDKEIAEYLEWLATSVPPTTTTTAPPPTTTTTTTAAPTPTVPTVPTTIPTVPPTIPTTKPVIPTTVPTTTAKPTSPTTAPTAPTNQAGAGKLMDGYVWYTPTKNFVVTSLFGPRVHPITGKPDTFHYGIDMAAAQGTPIYATRDGVVRVTAYQADGAGYYVSLGHTGGYISVYMHMTHYIVRQGEYVKAGQIIGYVGSTGGSTGPHLHFGIAKNSTYVDPLLYIYT